MGNHNPLINFCTHRQTGRKASIRNQSKFSQNTSRQPTFIPNHSKSFPARSQSVKTQSAKPGVYSAKSHSDKSHSAKSHSVKSRSAKPGVSPVFYLSVWVLACLCIQSWTYLASRERVEILFSMYMCELYV